MRLIRLKKLIGPLFWIISTYLVIKYQHQLIAVIRGETKVNVAKSGEFPQSNGESILGESSIEDGENIRSDNPTEITSFPGIKEDIPAYVKEIIEKTTTTVIEKGSQEVKETKSEITNKVCQQIISEIQQQCKIKSE